MMPMPLDVPAQIEYFMRANVADLSLTASISRLPAAFQRRIKITCSAHCGHFRALEETEDGVAISLFQPYEDSRLIYSLWVGGIGYRFKVYAVDSHGARKVLDAECQGGADLLTDAKGRSVVRVQEPPPNGPLSATGRRVDWTWTGRAFVQR